MAAQRERLVDDDYDGDYEVVQSRETVQDSRGNVRVMPASPGKGTQTWVTGSSWEAPEDREIGLDEHSGGWVDEIEANFEDTRVVRQAEVGAKSKGKKRVRSQKSVSFLVLPSTVYC